jgi:hypothetical protein
VADHVPPPEGYSAVAAEDAERMLIRQELVSSEAWKTLKSEFFPDELRFFQEAYLKTMAQLGEVLSTEETQVFHAVKYEVLMSRNLKQRKGALEDIRRLEDMHREFLGRFEGEPTKMRDRDRAYLLRLEAELTASRTAEKALTTEYTKLQERHADLMKSLKSTRDQRIKQIETDAKDGFLAVIKKLAARDEQERQGRQLELVKLAGQREYERLGQPIEYEDGSVDCPILSADTVGAE